MSNNKSHKRATFNINAIQEIFDESDIDDQEATIITIQTVNAINKAKSKLQRLDVEVNFTGWKIPVGKLIKELQHRSSTQKDCLMQ